MNGIRRVRKGQRLSIRAQDWNHVADVVEGIPPNLIAKARDLARVLNPVILPAWNTTGVDLEIGDAVQCAASYPYLPSTDLNAFRPARAFVGAKPSTPLQQNLAVCFEPIPSLEAGRVIVAGFAAAKVTFWDDTNDWYADCFVDYAGTQGVRLVAGPTGCCKILYRDPEATIEEGGEAWCLLAMNITPPPIYAQITGATAADSPAQNRWEYAWKSVTRWTNSNPTQSGGYGQFNVGTQREGEFGTLYNLAEDMNDGAGVEGMGIDVDGDDFPAGFEVQPIPDDRIVRAYPEVYVSSGKKYTEFWADWNNAVDGTCT